MVRAHARSACRAPAVGIEPTRSPLNRRAPDHSASLERSTGMRQQAGAWVIPARGHAPRAGASGCWAARGHVVARAGIDVELSETRATARSPMARGSLRPRREVGARDPGAGIEPAFLESESSVLTVGRTRSTRVGADPLGGSVGPKGLEPLPHRLRAECAAVTPRT